MLHVNYLFEALTLAEIFMLDPGPKKNFWYRFQSIVDIWGNWCNWRLCKIVFQCVVFSRDNVIYGIVEDTNENPY